MSYYPDLTAYEYYKKENSLNIGWLDGIHPFEQGAVKSDVLDHLWLFLHHPSVVHRGFHRCEICEKKSKMHMALYKEESMYLGCQEIRVFSRDSAAVYAAPSLIFHYISEHNYYPPEEFQNALLNGPQPGSIQYQTRLIRLQLKKNLAAWFRTK